MIRKIQKEQVEWVKRNFGDRPSWWPLLGAVEELGELAHAFLKREQGIRISEPHTENIKDAVADTVIYLADFCQAEGIDMQQVIEDTWAKTKQRDWKKFPINGISK